VKIKNLILVYQDMDYLVKKMKNMTDQLVSFKTAKLANDKGFLKLSNFPKQKKHWLLANLP